MKVTDKFVFFFSYNDMFSNHYRQKKPLVVDKLEFYTVEQFMMYKKAVLFNDMETASKIANEHRPQQAKMLGRQVKNFDNSFWESHRVTVVSYALAAKMLANPEILEQAMLHRSEGRKFVEASPYDSIWGVKLSEDDDRIENPINWRGQNLLGECWETAIDIIIKHG